ncbi:unnamed protein product, partial [Coccothraustes coccothraustes]
TKQSLTHLIQPLERHPWVLGSQGKLLAPTAGWARWDPNSLAHPRPTFGTALEQVSRAEISKCSWNGAGGFGFPLKGINPLLHASKGV